MIQAVLFDFNGVVIDDEALQMKAYQEGLRDAGIELTEEQYYDSLGMDDVTFVRVAFERAGKELDEETLRALIERKTELHRGLLEEGLPLFPGVVNFLKALHHAYPLGLVSMARRTEIDYALERAGLGETFEVVVSAEDAPRCKPDPACYERALELLNRNRAGAHVLPLRAAECLAVEDSPPGVASARAAGMRTLAVTNTVAERPLREAGAEVVTHSLADWTLDAVRHVFDKR
jgi:HAD superfamily hydrolase (TIGR01509 family)